MGEACSLKFKSLLRQLNTQSRSPQSPAPISLAFTSFKSIMNHQKSFDSEPSLSPTKNNSWAILFFALGALHIYAQLRFRSTRTQLLKPIAKKRIRSPNLSPNCQPFGALNFTPVRNSYFRVALGAVVVAGIIEILVF